VGCDLLDYDTMNSEIFAASFYRLYNECEQFGRNMQQI